jgi:hypothetical protein
VGRLEQLDHFFNKNKSEKKRRGRVFTLIFLYKTYYTKSKENEFSNAFVP